MSAQVPWPLQLDVVHADRQKPSPSLSWKPVAQVEQVVPVWPAAQVQAAVPVESAHVPWPEQVLAVHEGEQLPLPSLS